MTFCLGNREHTMGMFEFNDVYNFLQNQNAMIQFDRNEFWRELTRKSGDTYEAQATKESQIQSPALKYLHRLMAFLIPKEIW